MPNNKTFKDLRLSAGFTQEGLAAELGVTLRNVCRWERGEGQPSLPKFFKLKELFGDDIEMIFNKA